MDRRQKKTRNAIFDAFTELLSKKQYDKITIQEIIDRADVGRSTFYAHFETKEDLLKVVCEELYGHVFRSAAQPEGITAYTAGPRAPKSIFCHILQHLEKNDRNVLALFTCDSSDSFLRYFKNSMNDLVREVVLSQTTQVPHDLPQDFLVEHISASFIAMVQWWSRNGRKQTPEELDRYFRTVLPIPY